MEKETQEKKILLFNGSGQVSITNRFIFLEGLPFLLLIDFILVIIAALLGLLVFTVFSIFIAAVVNDAENPFTQNLLISMICTASFVIGLIYVKKIRDGIGDDEFFDDYSNTSYISLKEDLPKVLANEKWTLIFIGVIAILCYIINIVWFGVLGNTIICPVSFSMIAMTAFQIFFPSEGVGIVLQGFGFLISIAADIAAYISVLLLYRRRIWKKHRTQ